MKYGNLNLGQIEALVNILGGMDAVEALLRGEKKPGLVDGDNSYTVTIDYNQSLADMIKSGNYDWKNSDITSKNFPITGTGKVDVKLHLIHLNCEATTKEVETHLDTLGFQPAKIEHLLALGEKFPNLQREFPIVALGSVWLGRDGRSGVPCLDRNGSERGLDLRWRDPDNRWDGHCRFLAVSK